MSDEAGMNDSKAAVKSLSELIIPGVQVNELHSDQDVETLRMRQLWAPVVCSDLQIPDTYRKVAVLIIHWADHLDRDLNCKREVEQLKVLFTKRFKFKCELLPLTDARKPQNQLHAAVSKFIEDNDGPPRSNLLILYYTGHGLPYGEYGLNISGNRKRDRNIASDKYEAIANWNTVVELLKTADADVLNVLDTCYAGNLSKGAMEDVRSFQFLTAAGRDQVTSAPGDRSFTRALIQTLEEALDNEGGTPMTIRDLRLGIGRRRKTESHDFPEGPVSNTRDITLAPLKPTENAPPIQPHGDTAHLTIRLEFPDKCSLDDDEVVRLAKGVSSGVRGAGIPVCGIDLLKFNVHPKGDLWQHVRAKIYVDRWQRYTQSQRKKRALSDTSRTADGARKRQRYGSELEVDSSGQALPSPSPTTANSE